MKKRSTYDQNDRSFAQADPDLLLSEESLILLAMRELKGRLPPTLHQDGWGTDEVSRPATPHKPRTLLAHELEQRGWTVRNLAERMDVPTSEVLALVKGNSRVTSELAQRLAQAFATSVEFWL